MPESPEITVRDPRDPGRRGDLLGQGDDEPRRRPRRVTALGAVALLLVGVALLVGRDMARDRSEQRLRDAAFAEADEVHLVGSLLFVSAGASGGLVVFLQQVPRRPDGLVLEGIAVEGFDVVLETLQLPHRLPRGTGLGLFVGVRLRDCAAARASGLRVQVTLAEGSVRTVREAGPSVSQPQPGAVPAAEHLQGLVDAGCP